LVDDQNYSFNLTCLPQVGHIVFIGSAPADVTHVVKQVTHRIVASDHSVTINLDRADFSLS
jgi:hypothetical protein